MYDDTFALQHRIDTGGGILQLNPRTYNISRPLILPRTGYDPTKAVQVIGAGQYATNINLLPDFPTNRAAFEWATPSTDTNANQLLAQRIADFTITLPFGVDGVSAVRHVPFNKLDSIQAVMNEWVQIDIEQVTVKYTNAFNQVLFDFPNGFRFSTWDRVVGDGWQGLPNAQPKYDTLLLSVGIGNPGFPGEDSIGIGYSKLSRLRSVCNSGAWCQTFSGRMYSSSFSDCFDNGGRYGTKAIAFDFVNSSQLMLYNLICEGQGSKFLRFTNCDQVDAVQMTGGTPPINTGPYQDSIQLVNSRGVRIRGHIAIPGAMPFSGLTGAPHVVSMDKDCRDCSLEGFDVRINADSTIPIAAGREFAIDPAALRCRIGGVAVQSYGNVREPFLIGN